MNKLVKAYLLLLIHKKGLCKPLHAKSDDGFREIDGEMQRVGKGYCPLLRKAYDLLNKIQ